MPVWYANPIFWWFVAGAVLALLELTAPGILLIFFAAGAWVTALVLVVAHPSVPVQLAIFLVTSLAGLIFLRRRFTKILRGRKTGDADDGLDDEGFVGETAQTLTPIPAGGRGKVHFRGTEWSAEAPGGIALEAGVPVEVKARKGLTLIVGPAGTP